MNFSPHVGVAGASPSPFSSFIMRVCLIKRVCYREMSLRRLPLGWFSPGDGCWHLDGELSDIEQIWWWDLMKLCFQLVMQRENQTLDMWAASRILWLYWKGIIFTDSNKTWRTSLPWKDVAVKQSWGSWRTEEEKPSQAAWKQPRAALKYTLHSLSSLMRARYQISSCLL